jgi:hypothetical protein
MFGQWWLVPGAVVDGDDLGMVVELELLVAALEMALPTPKLTPTVPPRTAKPTTVLTMLLLRSFLPTGMLSRPHANTAT